MYQQTEEKREQKYVLRCDGRIRILSNHCCLTDLLVGREEAAQQKRAEEELRNGVSDTWEKLCDVGSR